VGLVRRADEVFTHRETLREAIGGLSPLEMDGSSQVGQQVRQERVGRGLGLREMARRVGTSPGYLRDIEAGRRRPSRAVKDRILAVFENDAPELLGFASDNREVLGILRMIRDGSDRWGSDRIIEDVVRVLFRWRAR
jgi:transcriptional regulator with XRE-family HTH domain